MTVVVVEAVLKEHVLPPSPKPALPSRAKKPSPVHSSTTSNHVSPTSNRSLPQLPKPSPKTSPKLNSKFGGHKSEHNGCNGSVVKIHNGMSSTKNKEDEKPMLPQKTLSPNDRSSNGRKLPIPPPNGLESSSNNSESNKMIGNGKVKIPSHLTNGNSNHDSSVPPTPPSPRSKPRGVSGSPLRINQSPNKSSTTTSSSSNTPTRKFEFGSKKNGFIEGSYKGNGHIGNGHGPSSGVSKDAAEHRPKNLHQHHSEVYLNSQFDVYDDGTSVDGDDHVDYNDQHDNEVSYVVQNGMAGFGLGGVTCSLLGDFDDGGSGGGCLEGDFTGEDSLGGKEGGLESSSSNYLLAFIIPPPPRAPPASVETTPARKFSSSLDRDSNEFRGSKISRDLEVSSREGSKDKISPKIASIQQQLVNLTSPVSGEPPSVISNNETNYEEKDAPIPFKIKSDTLSRKKIITNTRESKSWGRDDSGFAYKEEAGIPPPPPPPRSSIPKGMPASPNTRNFSNNISPAC